jgi:Na+-translocating ferredoxin:NAD+ oxidoreductase RNF subunit RnfB
MTGAVSRRDLFANLLAPLSRATTTATVPAAVKPQAAVAVVQGRFCLAYQRSFCSTCAERCPIEGAITVANGIPRVNPAACTGCGICHDLCPAPTNAILMLPKRTTPKP